MKRPIYNQHERQSIRSGTTYGAGLSLRLAALKLEREISRTEFFKWVSKKLELL
jgi:hypothetical protein